MCVIDIFSKYARVVRLKNKKDVTISNPFQKILDDSKNRSQGQLNVCKSNKIWVDKEIQFYNSSLKKWLKDNDTKMYSINNEGKSVFAERFISTINTKIYFNNA